MEYTYTLSFFPKDVMIETFLKMQGMQPDKLGKLSELVGFHHLHSEYTYLEIKTFFRDLLYPLSH